jgi:SAM-dependent methyltransferase
MASFRSLTAPLKSVAHRLNWWFYDRTLRSEYLSQVFRPNERPVEYAFVFQQLAYAAPHSVLDVGTGTTALPHLMHSCGYLVTAIDNVRDYWPARMVNRHYHVINDDVLNSKLSMKFDFITCVSVLEHIPVHEQAVRSMFSLLNPGGRLLLTIPYNETTYVDNVYRLPEAGYGRENPYVCQVFSRNQLDAWLEQNQAVLMTQELWQMFSGEFWTFGQRLLPPRQVSLPEAHHLACLILGKSPMM